MQTCLERPLPAMRTQLAFIIAEFKMYYRDRLALFWSLAFPIVLMLIFGFLNFGDDFAPPRLAIVDQANNETSGALIAGLNEGPGAVGSIEIQQSNDLEAARNSIRDGDLDAVLIIPGSFGTSDDVADLQVESNPEILQPAFASVAMIDEVLLDVFIEAAEVPERYRLASWANVSMSPVPAVADDNAERDFDYTPFVVTGVVVMAIMQSGVFSVAFIFVRLRSQGVLRRFKASPAGPMHFLIAMIITRMVVVALQTYVMLLLATAILDVDVGPGRPFSWIELGIIAIFASWVFIALGLIISNVAKTENSAAPLATGITLPMMFLSGVFFPLSVLPDWLSTVTQYLPLTFLADAFRPVVILGEPLWSQGTELLGLAVWAAIIFAVAVRVFRWE